MNLEYGDLLCFTDMAMTCSETPTHNKFHRLH